MSVGQLKSIVDLSAAAPTLTAMLLTYHFQEALVYAFEIHRTQCRKRSEVPYMAHLLAVAAITLEYGGDEDQAIAALLHDSPEDCGGQSRLDDIKLRFGWRVGSLVEACCETLERPKLPWRQRKETYLAGLETVPLEALLVCAADKLHNIQSMTADYRVLGEQLWCRFNAGKEDVLWFYRQLTSIHLRRNTNVISAELGRAMVLLEELARS